MAYADITLRITRLSMLELYTLGVRVETCMRNNTLFPAPPDPLDQLRSLLHDFSDLISAANEGSKRAYIARDACAQRVRIDLNALAHYVRSESGGDAAKLVTSGFPLRKTPVPMNVPAPTTHIAARPGKAEGLIELRWDPSKGTKMYTVFIAPMDDGTAWRELARTTRCSIKVDGFESGARHRFKVTATGTAGTGLESAVVIGMAA